MWQHETPMPLQTLRIGDPDELAEGFRPWELRFRQFGGGSFRGELKFLQLGRIQIVRASDNRRLHAQGSLPPGTARLKVTVPEKLWKVVVVLPREGARARKNTRVIAVIIPNDQNVGSDWAKYRTSARAVEKLTGLRFFSRLPGELADALRDHVDKVEVPAPRRRSR